ncbi:fat-body protein 1-like [Musca vetustissima]|uniref:fat-body protein 1-like n=1 Tax=Musca vetustissima TaxID=27455 RepID=UPI002AB684C0|nr:fat-body protein 1-like [Musca vetustissima]
MRNILILLCLAGFAACGVVTDQRQQQQQRLNVNGVRNNQNGVGRLYAMTREELLLQKFLLDVLKDVELPLRHENLLAIDIQGITNRNNYKGPLDADTQLVLDLIQSNRVLGRNDIYTLTQETVVRQQYGLSRLFAKSSDIQTLQRLVVYARQNINPILFVNSLIVALQERSDTQQLIIPALYEILPQAYNYATFIRIVGNKDITFGISNQNFQSSRLGQNVNNQDGDDDVLLSDDLDVRSLLDVLVSQLVVEQGSIQNSIGNGNQNVMVTGSSNIVGNIRNILVNKDNLLGRQSQLIDLNVGNLRDQNTGNILNRAYTTVGGLLGDRYTQQGLRDKNSGNNLNRGSSGNIFKRGYSAVDEFLIGHSLQQNSRDKNSESTLNRGYSGNTRNVVDVLDGRSSQLQNERDKNSGSNLIRGYSTIVDLLGGRTNQGSSRNQMSGDTVNGGEVLVGGRYGQQTQRSTNSASNFNRDTSNIGDTLRDRSTQNLGYGQQSQSNTNTGGNNIGDTLRVGSTQNLRQGTTLKDDPLSEDIIGGTIAQFKRQLIENVENSNIRGNRLPRSLTNSPLNNGRRQQQIVGRLIFYQLQQLVARLNLEQINLNTILLQDRRLDANSKTILIEQLQNINQRLEATLQQVVQHLKQKQQQRGVGGDQTGEQIILQEINQIVLNEILQEIINLAQYQQQVGGPISNILEDPITQILLRQIVITLDKQIQQLLATRSVENVAYNDVTINRLQIDQLRTFVDEVKVRFNNNNQNIIQGLQKRLNHKSFTINLEVNSQRTQNVVIRSLLIPKVDALGKELSLEQQRLNTILLDIGQLQLTAGRNTLKLKSRDIVSTDNGNVTPYLEIYQQVMGALQGQINRDTIDTIIGQTSLLPQRLLLPRGRVNGLPMQLLVVITPLVGNKINVNQSEIPLLGLQNILLDNLPIVYPLDRQISDIRQLANLSNVVLKDITIYHDD